MSQGRLELQLNRQKERLNLEFNLAEEAKKNPPKKSTTNGSDNSGVGFIKTPKMPYFDEDKDFMDSYLNRFEKFATSQKWDKTT